MWHKFNSIHIASCSAATAWVQLVTVTLRWRYIVSPTRYILCIILMRAFYCMASLESRACSLQTLQGSFKRDVLVNTSFHVFEFSTQNYTNLRRCVLLLLLVHTVCLLRGIVGYCNSWQIFAWVALFCLK